MSVHGKMSWLGGGAFVLGLIGATVQDWAGLVASVTGLVVAITGLVHIWAARGAKSEPVRTEPTLPPQAQGG